MPDARSLIEVLAELGGADVQLRCGTLTLGAAVLSLPAGRRVLVLERTYREGTRVVVDPTPEEIEAIRNGDPWQVWNSDRAVSLVSVV